MGRGAGSRGAAATCWPGPLTLLLARPNGCSTLSPAGGHRRPARAAHPVAQTCSVASVAASPRPSANRFGHVSPTTARHVVDDLGPLLDPRVDVILDGGPSPIGVESTIVDCTVDPPQLLRPGGIPAEDIERLLDQALAPTNRTVGRRGCWRRTAPSAEVVLVDTSQEGEQRAGALATRRGRVELLDPVDRPRPLRPRAVLAAPVTPTPRASRSSSPCCHRHAGSATPSAQPPHESRGRTTLIHPSI